jgi:hypothetical protein
MKAKHMKISTFDYLRRVITKRFRDWISRFRLLLVKIEGIEATQAIQYYHADQHLTDPNDRGPDNSVRLVANKPVWVRVYVRSTILEQVENVTGQLLVQHRQNGIFQDVVTLTPEPPGSVVTAFSNPNYAMERSTRDATLNFIIPAADLHGYMRLVASVSRGDSASSDDEMTVNLDVTLRQTLSVRGIFVSYNGTDGKTPPTNLNLAAPTLADLQSTAAWTLTTNPVASTATFASAGTLAWSTPLTDPASCPGCCSPNWVSLNAAIAQVKNNDGNKSGVLYYGLLPNAIPVDITGCSSGGVGSGPEGDGPTMAHELGHMLGLAHAPCGNVPLDPNYPTYEPYDTSPPTNASIGEYGLNINDGTILTPQNFKDYMSYCGSRWISLYSYNQLIWNSLLNPEIIDHDSFLGDDDWILVDDDPFPDPPPDPLISIIGVIHSDRELEVRSIMRVTAVQRIRNGQSTKFVAHLLNAQGQPIVTGKLYRLVSRGLAGACNCPVDYDQSPYLFQAFLPDVEPGDALRILRTGDVEPEEVWYRHAPSHPPRINEFRVRVLDARKLHAEWSVERANQQTLDFSLQWSKDQGASWNGLTVGLHRNSITLDLIGVPHGEVLFKLLAHDGFFTSSFISEVIRIPFSPPIATIMYPQDRTVVIAGHSCRLWAVITDCSGQAIDRMSCRWLIDGKEVAQGWDTWIVAPPEGEHRCTLIAEGETQVEQSTTFRTKNRNPERLSVSG